MRRTDQTVGGTGSIQYSYMIRDAVLGLLPGLPSDLLYDEPPTNPRTWELTRFVAVKAAVAAKMLNIINEYLYSRGAQSCLCLGSKGFLRMARMVGWDVKQVGPVSGNHNGRFLVFDCPVVDPKTLTEKGIKRI